MSNLVFPTLPGLEWGIARASIFSTTRRSSVSGRLYTAANFAYPRYKYTLSYSVLRQGGALAELEQIVGLFNRCYGDFDTFLWTDPDDCTATAQATGVGDGTSTQYQLVRTWGGFVEPVLDLNGTPSIYVSGTVQSPGTDYTLSSTGLVTFATAPTQGQALTWAGSYYRRVRFCQSTLQATKFLHALWEAKKVEFESWRP